MMNGEMILKDELASLYRTFQSEMRGLPAPLNELVSKSRKGFTEDNVMLCLPFWLLTLFDFPDKLNLTRAMALANCYGTAYFLAQDRTIDAAFPDNNQLIIANVHLAKWVNEYRKCFGSTSRFWDFFEKYITEYSNSVYWEKKEHWGKITPFTEEDLVYLGHKFSPTKICCAGMSIANNGEKHINDLSNILDCYHIGFQLRDDYIDWKRDLRTQNYTYFLWALSNDIKGMEPCNRLTENNIEETILMTNVVEDVLDKSSHYLLLAKDISDRLGCTPLSDHLTRLMQKNEKSKALLSEQKAFHERVRGVGPDDKSTLMLREMHKFSYGDEGYILLVGSSKIYKMDHISNEIVSLANSARPKDVFSCLHKRFPEAEIKGALQELLRDNILGYEMEKREPLQPSSDRRVRTLCLDVTHACNMKCLYCYGDGGSYGTEGSTMSKDIIRNALDWMLDNSQEEDECNIVLFGGEPLLNMELIKYAVEYAQHISLEHNRQMRFHVVTNGTLLTDEIISYFDSCDIRVQISMDGPPEIQNYNRPFRNGACSYDAVHAGAARLIRKRKGRVSVRSTITPQRLDLKKIATHLDDLGFANVYIEPAAGNGRSHFFNTDDYQELKIQYDTLAESFIQQIRNRSKMAFSNFLPLIARIHYGQKRNYFCGAGRSYLAVSPEGGIYPCHRFIGDDSYCMGNVHDRKMEGREDFYLCSVENIPYCSTCWARYLCGGGCPWSANLKNNLIFSPDQDRCDLMRHVIGLSMRIYTQISEDDKLYLEKAYKIAERPYMHDKK